MPTLSDNGKTITKQPNIRSVLARTSFDPSGDKDAQTSGRQLPEVDA
jgi:hypothetical protein